MKAQNGKGYAKKAYWANTQGVEVVGTQGVRVEAWNSCMDNRSLSV